MIKVLRIRMALVLSLLVGMGACSSKKQEDATEKPKNEAFKDAQSALSERIDKIIHDLPPPSELPNMLKSTGLDYYSDIANSLDHVDRYMLSNSKAALNLGIYATDIGYLSSHNRLQEALDYMSACQKIADDIGISTAFGEDLIDRFQQNISEPDSLVKIINEGIQRAEERLEDLDELTMAALTLSGSFVEGIYIATRLIEYHSIERAQGSEETQTILALIDIILRQKTSLLNLISMLKSTERDTHTVKLLEQMNVLRFKYDDFEVYVETQTDDEAKTNTDNPAIKDLMNEIKIIRAGIVSLQS